MAFIRSRGVRIALAGSALAGLLGVAGGVWFYTEFLSDLPDLQTIADYRPAVVSTVLDRNGRPVGEFYNERRRMVPIEEIPEHTKRAFVSAEDANFYEHAGIDWRAIIRAAYVDLMARSIEQGASTITMQMTKQLLLSPERKFRRKLREMILAWRIEQHFSKDEILYLYLNQIYFGHGAHGIGDAAHAYFSKPVSELTVSESALLAGLPQRPSDYSPYANPKAAESRRRYVLRRLHEDAVIDTATYEEALASPPELIDPAEWEDFQAARYFNEEVRRYLYDRFGGDVVLNDGLVIETSLDIDLQKAAVAAVRKGLEDHDRRQGYRGPLRRVPAEEIEAELLALQEENDLAPQVPEETEVPEETAEGQQAAAEPGAAPAPEHEAAPALAARPAEPATGADAETAAEPEPPIREIEVGEQLVGVVLEVDRAEDRARVGFSPRVEAWVHLEDVDWAREPDVSSRPRSVRDIEKIFAVGDVAEFERLAGTEREIDEPETDDASADDAEPPWYARLWQRPTVQGALLSLDVATGDVLALVGGYDYDASEFNRVTQARRQPGSAFKPLIYGAAISRDYSPVSIIYDRPAVYEDPISGFVWRPQNYGRKFYGPMTMRSALARSVNNATVHLFRDVGVDYVIDYARRLGIQAPLSRDLSLALGSSGVPLLELTRAYAVYPNRGRRVVPRFIHRVTDREGRVLLEDVPLGDAPPADGDAPEEAGQGTAVAAAAPEGPDADGGPTAPDQLISEEAAFLMCDMLKAVVFDPRGTGHRLRRLGRPVAGKTGTTNNQADAWFMGFSPDVATGVWVGYDEKKVLGWGETGSRAAAPIWIDYMEVALAKRPARDFEPPDTIVFRSVDRDTGLLADRSTSDAYFQPFRPGNEPTASTGAALVVDDAARALRNDSF